ncbi:hypothetical protein HOY80DRAFT_962370, partial [Tuber brumale]
MGDSEGSSLGLVLFLLFALHLFPSTPPPFPNPISILASFHCLSPFLLPFSFWWSALLESNFRVCSTACTMLLVWPPTSPIGPSIAGISPSWI